MFTSSIMTSTVTVQSTRLELTGLPLDLTKSAQPHHWQLNPHPLWNQSWVNFHHVKLY
jgi:hypothetical protein